MLLLFLHYPSTIRLLSLYGTNVLMLLLDCLGDAVRGIGIASGETLPTPGALMHIQNQTLFFTPLGAGGSGLCHPCDIMRWTWAVSAPPPQSYRSAGYGNARQKGARTLRLLRDRAS